MYDLVKIFYKIVKSIKIEKKKNQRTSKALRLRTNYYYMNFKRILQKSFKNNKDNFELENYS